MSHDRCRLPSSDKMAEIKTKTELGKKEGKVENEKIESWKNSKKPVELSFNSFLIHFPIIPKSPTFMGKNGKKRMKKNGKN